MEPEGFADPSSLIRDHDTFIFDCDGTSLHAPVAASHRCTAGVIWHGNELIAGQLSLCCSSCIVLQMLLPFPDLWFTSGAADAIQQLRALGKKVLFVTNSSARSRAALLHKLNSIGIEGGDEDDMITAASAVALHLTTARTLLRIPLYSLVLCETAAICLPLPVVSPIAVSVFHCHRST